MVRKIELGWGEVICSKCGGIGCSKCWDGKIDWIENILGKKKQLNVLKGEWKIVRGHPEDLNIFLSDESYKDLVQSIVGEIDKDIKEEIKEEIKRKDKVEGSRLIKLTMEQKYIKKGEQKGR